MTEGVEKDRAHLMRRYAAAQADEAKAWTKHEDAMKKFDSFVNNRTSKSTFGGTSSEESATRLRAHLRVLSLRQQSKHLKALQGTIKEILAAKVSLNEDSDRTPNKDVDELHELEHLTSGGDAERTAVEEQKRMLELAVLKAKAKFVREQALQEAAKGTTVNAAATNGATAETETTRLMALQKVREELQQWIESKLNSIGSSTAVEDIDASDERSEADSVRKLINESYESYLIARSEFVATMSNASAPLSSSSLISSNDDADAVERVVPLASSISSDLGFQILPLLTSRATAQQLSQYATTQTKSAHDSLMSTLNRLQDESHLLASYQSTLADARKVSEAESEIVRNLKVWTDAEQQARVDLNMFVREKTASGERAIEKAKAELFESARTQGIELKDAYEDETAQNEENDLWISNKDLIRRPRLESGLWSNIGGNMGLPRVPKG